MVTLSRALAHSAWSCLAKLPARSPLSHVRNAMSTASPSLDTEEVLKTIEGAVGPLSRGPMVALPEPVVLVVSGPSGVGKDSIVDRLLQLRPELHFVVTATSRAMRPGEKDGVDYHFVDKAQFERWIADGDLLEHALVYGQYKGIPRQEVTDAVQRGLDVVLRLDVQGAATVQRMLPGVVSVFIVAQSEAELVQRLTERKTETPEALVKRVGTIKEELARIDEFEFVIVNAEGGLERAAAQLSSIIDAVKCRTSRRKARAAWTAPE